MIQVAWAASGWLAARVIVQLRLMVKPIECTTGSSHCCNSYGRCVIGCCSSTCSLTQALFKQYACRLRYRPMFIACNGGQGAIKLITNSHINLLLRLCY
jgi:hypothetical protein